MPLFVRTIISSAFLIVDNLCATITVVLPLQSSSNDCCIKSSVALSRADVASSNISIGGF